jgi:Holliday junction resolvase RusA-like endonuclease
MRQLHSSPEYRIVIPGKAVSFRSPKSGDYKTVIQEAAKRTFTEPIVGETVEVRLDYFHLNRRRMDMDNIAKCVLDALTGIAYVDDRQVQLQASIAYSLASVVVIDQGVVDLIKPLAQYEEYLFIRVRDVRSAITKPNKSLKKGATKRRHAP